MLNIHKRVSAVGSLLVHGHRILTEPEQSSSHPSIPSTLFVTYQTHSSWGGVIKASVHLQTSSNKAGRLRCSSVWGLETQQSLQNGGSMKGAAFRSRVFTSTSQNSSRRGGVWLLLEKPRHLLVPPLFSLAKTSTVLTFAQIPGSLCKKMDAICSLLLSPWDRNPSCTYAPR